MNHNASAKIGTGSISVTRTEDYDPESRVVFEWEILDRSMVLQSGRDLRSGANGVGATPEGMLRTLASFLGAAAEAYAATTLAGRGHSENSSLFNDTVNEWAYQNSDELSMIGLEPEGMNA